MYKIKKLLPFIYIFFLVSVYLYVRSVINETNLDIEDKQPMKKEPKKHEAVVFLEIYDQDNTLLTKYRSKLNTLETFNDFLTDLQKNKNFSFEKTSYTYGIEYDFINNIVAPEGYQWKVYENDVDITLDSEKRFLVDQAVYKLILEKRELTRILKPL